MFDVLLVFFVFTINLFTYLIPIERSFGKYINDIESDWNKLKKRYQLEWEKQLD